MFQQMKNLQPVFFLLLGIFTLASCTQPGTESTEATKITLTPETQTITVGDTIAFEIVVEPAGAADKDYQLSVDNPDVAVLEGNVLTAIAEGTATVTATLGKLMTSAVIIVEDPRPDVPVTIELKSSFCEVYYWGHFRGGTDNITIHLGDDILHSQMYIQGEGQSVIISLQVPHFEDFNDAEIVPGSYEYDEYGTFKAMSIVAQETYYGVYRPDENGDGYVEASLYQTSNATVTISESSKGYRLEAVLTLNNGEVLWVYYDGKVDYYNKYADMQPDEIDGDMEFESGYGEITYYGAGEYMILLLEGEDGSITNRTDRNSVHIYTVSEKNDNTAVAPGQYEVGNQGTNWIAEGGWFFDGYTSGAYGSYYYFYKTAASIYDESHTFGFFRGGTVDIGRNGENYSITVDVVDANGYSIKTTYNGPMTFYDNTSEQ